MKKYAMEKSKRSAIVGLIYQVINSCMRGKKLVKMRLKPLRMGIPDTITSSSCIVGTFKETRIG